jgi:hypothetical protein
MSTNERTRRDFIDNTDNTDNGIFRRNVSERRRDDGESFDKNASSLQGDHGASKLIFRYKFGESFAQELYEFSKIHQYDDREMFKESWIAWTEENEELIESEIERLHKLGYQGDILNKMFKSSRYYFRKKSTEKKAPAQRRSYVSVSQDLLSSIDEFISKNMETKPAESFIEYCKANTDILQEEVACLLNKGMKDHIEIRDKIKKTYKNRYFNAFG